MTQLRPEVPFLPDAAISTGDRASCPLAASGHRLVTASGQILVAPTPIQDVRCAPSLYEQAGVANVPCVRS